MYEFHTSQEGTGVQPGQTINLDYSVTRMLPLGDGMMLQAGVVGYEQRQTTDKSGPGITAGAGRRRATRSTRWASRDNLSLPARGVGLGLRYYKEFSNRSTFAGLFAADLRLGRLLTA